MFFLNIQKPKNYLSKINYHQLSSKNASLFPGAYTTLE